MHVPALEASAPRSSAPAESRPHGLVTNGAIWRDALLVWTLQHVALVAVTWLAVRPTSLQQWLMPWTNWDGQTLAQIAANGYAHPAQAAFYPFYPLLERLASLPTGLDPALAGVLIANAATLVALALLGALAERELGRKAARRALFALAVFPTALFLTAAYAESLFLLLSLAAFLALRAHRWPLTGFFIALATLTRPLGILLLAAVAAEVWTSSPRLRAALSHPRTLLSALRVPSPSSVNSASNLAAAVNSVSSVVKSPRSVSATSALKLCSAFALPVLALAGYAGYLAARFGSPLTFLTAEGGTWQRGVTWPWQSVASVVGAALADTLPHRFHALVDLALLTLVLILAVRMARRLPQPYSLYTWATLALILLIPSHLHDWSALTSDKRFYVVLFPLFLLLVHVPRRRWIEPFAVVAAVLLQIVLALIFLRGGWVA